MRTTAFARRRRGGGARVLRHGKTRSSSTPLLHHGTDAFERQARATAERFGAGVERPLRQPLPAPAATPPLPASVGTPLPQVLREPLEQRLDADFSAVRLHRDVPAGAAARARHTNAFAAGAHVYMDPAAPTPLSADGQQLLVHELTHVLQQTGRRAADGRLAAHDLRGPGPVQRNHDWTRPTATRAEADLALVRNAHYRALEQVDEATRERFVVFTDARAGRLGFRLRMPGEAPEVALAAEVLGPEFDAAALGLPERGFLYDVLAMSGQHEAAWRLLRRDSRIPSVGISRPMTDYVSARPGIRRWVARRWQNYAWIRNRWREDMHPRNVAFLLEAGHPAPAIAAVAGRVRDITAAQRDVNRLDYNDGMAIAYAELHEFDRQLVRGFERLRRRAQAEPSALFAQRERVYAEGVRFIVRDVRRDWPEFLGLLAPQLDALDSLAQRVSATMVEVLRVYRERQPLLATATLAGGVREVQASSELAFASREGRLGSHPALQVLQEAFVASAANLYGVSSTGALTAPSIEEVAAHAQTLSQALDTAFATGLRPAFAAALRATASRPTSEVHARPVAFALLMNFVRRYQWLIQPLRHAERDSNTRGIARLRSARALDAYSRALGWGALGRVTERVLTARAPAELQLALAADWRHDRAGSTPARFVEEMPQGVTELRPLSAQDIVDLAGLLQRVELRNNLTRLLDAEEGRLVRGRGDVRARAREGGRTHPASGRGVTLRSPALTAGLRRYIAPSFESTLR